MKIGTIDFGERPLFLAPMEDVTDIGFVRCVNALVLQCLYRVCVGRCHIRSIKSTLNKIVIDEDERPVGIQIYGKDVDSMVEGKLKIVERVNPDIIDIKFRVAQ